ncbi:Gfo/Idh/MocA family protein [Cohnella fermenti]|uniref:Gfo/Idh/MocA family oxidoreductase n=1 Tax=Cohnella fermenti TaxID=2565925 RepID=A0A4V3WDW3_9BACL|nr:Gfo/Idh/MocA family oxidoreductase [Cohnella fermenti]THF73831.1 Gfo/Idh/MocA family oxidoreductase [Cohnella fermenti]
MMNDKVRLGVIGTGRFGRLHLKVLSRLPEVRIAALSDTDRGALEEAGAQFGISSHNLYDDPLMLIMDPDIDAVDIVSDESSHGPLILSALRNGKHVIVEKPLCVMEPQAREIAQASRDSGKLVLVGQISRFGQPYRMIKRAVDEGRLGKVAAIRAKRNFSRSWFEAFGNRIHPVYESGIHEIDLVVWYANSRCTEVSAFERKAAGYRYPDVFSALLAFENGIVASIDSSWLLPRGAPRNLVENLELDGTIDAEIEVIGEAGTARYQLAHPGFNIWTSEETLYPDAMLWPLEEEERVGGAIAAELTHFVHSILAGRPSSVMPLEESVQAIRIADAIVRSAAQNRTIQLEEE